MTSQYVRGCGDGSGSCSTKGEMCVLLILRVMGAGPDDDWKQGGRLFASLNDVKEKPPARIVAISVPIHNAVANSRSGEIGRTKT